MSIIIIIISLWLLSGFILGYILSIIIHKKFMTTKDILLSMISGLFNIIFIWNDKLKTIIIFKPKEENKK